MANNNNNRDKDGQNRAGRDSQGQGRSQTQGQSQSRSGAMGPEEAGHLGGTAPHKCRGFECQEQGHKDRNRGNE
jgi:hypothetical protein